MWFVSSSVSNEDVIDGDGDEASTAVPHLEYDMGEGWRTSAALATHT